MLYIAQKNRLTGLFQLFDRYFVPGFFIIQAIVLKLSFYAMAIQEQEGMRVSA